MMNKTIILILSIISLSSYSQQKEWAEIITLLKNEAQYFEGKKGYIRFSAQEYNTFTIEKFSVNDSLVNLAMKLQDGFGNEGTELFLEETIVLEPEMKITSAAIAYGYRFYFRDFPEAQFLELVFEEEFPMIQKISSTYKDLKTGQEDRSVIEETTYQIYFPIRNRNRKKIFKAIDKYQLQTLKKELESDRTH